MKHIADDGRQPEAWAVDNSRERLLRSPHARDAKRHCADVRNLRALAADGRACDPLLAGRRRVRRRLPALRGDRPRARLAARGEPVDADRSARRPSPQEPLERPARRRQARRGGARRGRADPAPSLRARARARRGRRPLQLEPAPPHGRGRRQEPRRAEVLDRPALRRERRDGRHGHLGDLLVPVPRLARRAAAGTARRARPRPGGARRELPGVERAARRRRPA